MREIPAKNYFILAILSIITIVVVFAIYNIYNNYNMNRESYISQNILNVNSKDMKNLLIENDILFMYVDNISNTKNEENEKEVLDLINQYNLKNYFVFYNNKSAENINYLKDNFKIDIKNKRMIIVFEDGKVFKKSVLGDNFKNDIIEMIIAIGV